MGRLGEGSGGGERGGGGFCYCSWISARVRGRGQISSQLSSNHGLMMTSSSSPFSSASSSSASVFFSRLKGNRGHELLLLLFLMLALRGGIARVQGPEPLKRGGTGGDAVPSVMMEGLRKPRKRCRSENV